MARDRLGTERAREWEVNTNQAAFLNNETGVYLQHYGSLAEARPFYEQALAICEKALGPNHPTTKIVRGNLNSLNSQS
ncbi:MAG: tetratricopeptide repeat protein [Chloroflexota bacterium]